jgi:hypothetical protein
MLNQSPARHPALQRKPRGVICPAVTRISASEEIPFDDNTPEV